MAMNKPIEEIRVVSSDYSAQNWAGEWEKEGYRVKSKARHEKRFGFTWMVKQPRGPMGRFRTRGSCRWAIAAGELVSGGRTA